jgi:hypothetical protein
MANLQGTTPNASDAKTTQQLYSTASTGFQTHFINIDAGGVMQNDALIAASEAGDTFGYRLERDLKGFYAAAGTFQYATNFYSSIRFGTGTPPNPADISITGQSPRVQPSLFVARVYEKPYFGWGIAAGGDGSGMGTRNGGVGDIVLAAHPSHSVTVAGLFNNSATFGDQYTEVLTTPQTTMPYVVHLNSEEEYDYCP